MNDNNSRRQDDTRSNQPYGDLSHIQGSAIRGPGVSKSSNGNGSGPEESTSSCVGTGSDDHKGISLVKDFMSSLLDLKPKLTKAQRRKQLKQCKIRRDRKRRVNRLSAQRKRVREKGTLESLTHKNSILLGEKEALKREKSKIALLIQGLTELKAKLAQTREEKIAAFSSTENPLEELAGELEAVEESRQEVLHRISLTQSQRQTQTSTSSDETSADYAMRDDGGARAPSASTVQYASGNDDDDAVKGLHMLVAALMSGALSGGTTCSTSVSVVDNPIPQSAPASVGILGSNTQLLEQLQGLLSAQAPVASACSHAVSTTASAVPATQDPLQSLLSALGCTQQVQPAAQAPRASVESQIQSLLASLRGS